MIIKDYYKMLGLDTNKVEMDEIKTAYREQAKKYHPDVNVGDARAEDRIKDINEAYNILSNPVTRKKYDRIIPEYYSPLFYPICTFWMRLPISHGWCKALWIHQSGNTRQRNPWSLWRLCGCTTAIPRK